VNQILDILDDEHIGDVDENEMIVDKELLDTIRDLSNQYAMAQFRTSYNISREEINIFFGILLLSGYNTTTDYPMYWSNSEDSENKMVKGAMSRGRFKTIKKCIHFGIIEDKEGETPDRYKKVHLLIKHMQKKFAEMFVPEQNLSHDKAMIKYFRKSGLKQVIRNKPIKS
jgi:Transposase IS4